jgi:peptidoglycan/xylan/chitin deacetylase (PgdA/CDA1 family)
VLGLAGAAAVGSSGVACTSRSSPATVPTASAPAPDPTPATPAARRSRPAGPDITHGPRTRQAVALTFHGDGPEAIVRRVIAALRRVDAHVTVLAVGRWLVSAPDVVRQLRDAGHELGNHTWSHLPMPRLSAARIRTEVDRAAAELETLTGSAGRWFRPSGTPRSTPAIRAASVAAGYGACLGYDVDPMDYTDPGPDAIVGSLARQVRPGSIVSLHLGHPGTVAALPTVLALLHDRGLAPVTASALLGARTNG